MTNDDGINAPGLAVLEAIAAEIAGPEGEVWVVAPAFEQSGVGHCISYTHPTMIAELAPRRWAAEGSPADCVMAGIHDVLPAPPDLVLSGVNRGNNSGENAVYSGTLGGAMEGALQRIPSIAMSQFLGPRNMKLSDPFEAAAAHGARIVRLLLDRGFWGGGTGGGAGGDGYHLFYNVNFPALPAAEVLGHQVTRQGLRPTFGFGVEGHVSPTGRRFLWVRGSEQAVDAGAGTDVTANLGGYVSITPMRADLTAHDTLGELEARLA